MGWEGRGCVFYLLPEVYTGLDLVVISSEGNEWVAEELSMPDRACGSSDTETQTALLTPGKSGCLLIRVGCRKREPVARLNCSCPDGIIKGQILDKAGVICSGTVYLCIIAIQGASQISIRQLNKDQYQYLVSYLQDRCESGFSLLI